MTYSGPNVEEDDVSTTFYRGGFIRWVFTTKFMGVADQLY